MTDRTRILAARTLWIVGIGLAVIDVAFAISSFPITNRQYSVGDVMFTIMTAVVSVVYGTAGMLVTTRKGSVLGWIFGVVGISLALGPFSEQYVLFATVTHPGSLPGPSGSRCSPPPTGSEERASRLCCCCSPTAIHPRRGGDGCNRFCPPPSSSRSSRSS